MAPPQLALHRPSPFRAHSPSAILGDRLIQGIIGFTVVVCAWLTLGVTSVHSRVVVFWAAQAVLGAVFGILCLRVARMPASGRAERVFFRRIALTGGLLMAADLSQTAILIARPGSFDLRGAPLATALVIAGAVVALWALLSYPIRAVGRERLRWWLDAGAIMTGAAAFVWYLLWTESAQTGGVRLIVVLVGSGLILVCGFGLLKLQLSGYAPVTRCAAIAGSVAALLAAAETAFSAVPIAGQGDLGIRMAVYLLPSAMLALVPRIQEIQANEQPVRRRGGARGRTHSLLPYIALGATLALLALVLVDDGTSARAWGILGAVVLGTALVMVRQFVAFADNDRLLTSLDSAMLSMRQQEQRFRALVQHASDITLVTNEDWVITYGSPATNRVLGVTPSALLGGTVGDLAHPDDRAGWREAAQKVRAATRMTSTAQIRVRHAQGSWRWLQVVATNLLDDPSVAGIICNARDITDARQLQERLRHEATHDPLTRLANRALFDERIRRYATSDLSSPDKVGVLVIDLDNFKKVNDTLGHTVGDGLLTAVAARLRSCVEPADTVARLGGDEFAVLLPGACPVRTTTAATRIVGMLGTPVPVEGLRLSVRASIGGAVGLRTDALALLRVSDQAMYEAKRAGTGVIIRDLSQLDRAPA